MRDGKPGKAGPSYLQAILSRSGGGLLPRGSRRAAPRGRLADTLADPAVLRILAIGSLVVKRARLGRVEIDELVVRRLKVLEG